VTTLHRLFRLTLAGSAATVLACSNYDTGPSGNGTISASIDGASWTGATTVQASYIASVFVVGGLDGQARQIVITIPDVAAAGTFSLNSGQAAFAVVSFGAQIWSTTLTGGTGSVTISTWSGSHAVGTFSFTAPPNTGSGATGTKVITSGTFDVRY
jgi:hypothetical protein